MREKIEQVFYSILIVVMLITPVYSDTIQPSNKKKTISIEISTDVWPCFPTYYNYGLELISPLFNFPNEISVKISDGAVLLSGTKLQEKCNSIYNTVNLSIRDIDAMVGIPNEREAQNTKIRLEELISYPISFEIWGFILEKIKLLEMNRHVYFITIGRIEYTYKYASVCSLNASIRKAYPAVCNYSNFVEMMNIASQEYDRLLTEGIPKTIGKGARESIALSASKAKEKFYLLDPWTK